MRFSVLFSLPLSVVGLGCSGDDGDTDTDTDGPADTDATGEPLVATLTYADYLTGAPVSGATVTLDAQSETTDAAGAASFEVAPNAEYHFVATMEGYGDLHEFGHNDADGFSVNPLWVSEGTADILSSALALPLDPAKGFVVVTVFVADASGDLQYLPGATVELDAAYDAALVPDSAAPPLYLSPGNTTLPDSSAFVTFVNTTAGPVKATITPPAGHTCTVFPGVATDLSLTVFAGAWTSMSFVCDM